MIMYMVVRKEIKVGDVFSLWIMVYDIIVQLHLSKFVFLLVGR